MILLTMTLCLAAGGADAECRKSSRIVPTMLECRKRSDAMEACITETAQAPGVKVIYLGSECSTGVDG